MKTLRLTLKKQWFDMIKSGVKKEEYREIKLYWIKRLTAEFGFEYSETIAEFKKFDTIEFVNGYSPNSPRFTIECLGIEIGKGNQDWGAKTGEKYFKIKLGEIQKADAQKEQCHG